MHWVFLARKTISGVVTRLVYQRASGTQQRRQIVVRLCVVGKGQSILANQADIPSLRNDIEGKNDIDGMTKMLGDALKPIHVDASLLEYLEPKKASGIY